MPGLAMVLTGLVWLALYGLARRRVARRVIPKDDPLLHLEAAPRQGVFAGRVSRLGTGPPVPAGRTKR